MNNQGFAKFHRKILEWEWYDDANVFRVFFHCVLKANWKEKTWRGIKIKRGSFFSSAEKIGSELSLSRDQVNRVFVKLKETGEISTEAHSKGSMITVCKYDDYNELPKERAQQPHSNRATDRAAGAQQPHTTKKDKKGKEEKEITDPPPVEVFPPPTEVMILEQKIKKLKPEWSGAFTQVEQHILEKNIESFRGYDFEAVTKWLASKPPYEPENRLKFIEQGGVTEKGRSTKQPNGKNNRTDGTANAESNRDWTSHEI